MWPHQVSINVREGIGFVLILAGLVLTPLAWMWSARLWLLAFSLYTGGVVLFVTNRMAKRFEESDGDGSEGGRALPTDIHDYTGWSTGGRSSTMYDEFGTGDNGDSD
ncbi:MAG: hypothetical protein LC667_19465 [Thioalkalivibrio sp.]|nr:hypothetical protein [Thioalkalivibrio sp.]